ncbi:MAG: acyl-CoA thioesterase [Candidatus Cloacimonetes bacterium]|nr:acyl-CoA thioesterase [Candidatus Cloacimonadota bacterium]
MEKIKSKYMKNSNAKPSQKFTYEFTVLEENLDQNGHVNNVVYVKWMQDVAIRHSNTCGGTKAMQKAGAIWVVRSHKIDYLQPAFAGDQIIATTWVKSFKRVQSRRFYEFTRKQDGITLAKGKTDWVFVDAKTGRPKRIPQTVIDCFYREL